MPAPLVNRIRQLFRAEHGFALIFALGAMVALGATTTTAIVYATQNESSASRSKADATALALAEAGANNALAVLNASQCPRCTDAVPRASQGYEGGTAEWFGVLTGGVWTLTGIGHVRNPTGPGAPEVTRTVSVRASLGSARRASANNAVWNYIYADSLVGCTSFANSVVVDVPVYIRGNLCMTNSAQMTGDSLRVGGNLTISQSATVGTATQPIREVHIAGTCTLNGGTPHSPCGPADSVYGTTIDTDNSGLTKPAVDLPYWYENSMPGPRHRCTTGSFPGGFDNDTVMNRSLTQPVDLAPTTAYDCTVRDANGFIVGRIAWTPGRPGKLILQGTIFFDGDIVFRQQTDLVYEGKATIYASGKITIANQTIICGAPGCPDNWNPNTSMLALVAGSSTDQVGFSIGNYSKFQGAIYAVTDFKDGNNTITWGPVIANQIHLQNSTLNFYVPIDTLIPGMPATYEEVTTINLLPGSWS